VLDAEATPFIDVSAVRMLGELSGDLERRDVVLLLAGEIGQVRDVLRRAGGEAGVRQVFANVAQAVEAVRDGAGSTRSAPPP
jgi:SulP family sulfate permease